MSRRRILLTVAALALPAQVSAQSLGTFRWQLQPYCNVVSLTVTQVGGQYRLEGTDDQCGGGRDLAAVQGMAFANPDGTIGFGMTIVTVPGGRPVHVDAEIAIPTLSGTWRDSAGGTGAFLFTPGAGVGGAPRPMPTQAVVPVAVQLSSTGSIVATGAVGQGTVPTSGPGVRMMWYPGKVAFRVGQSLGAEWDEPNIGHGSNAFGGRTTASGFFSTAFGFDTTASDGASTAFGSSTVASGRFSTAIGYDSRASNYASTAIGWSSRASGEAGTAIGVRAVAVGDASTAMGARATANGLASTAMGYETVAGTEYSTALGFRTHAAGIASTALGSNTLAGGQVSLAAGSNTSATGDFSTSLGSKASTNAQRGSFIYGDASTVSITPGFIGNDAPNEVAALQQLTHDQFMVRAAGGYKLFSNAALTAGVQVAPGGNDFAALSDANAKENFRDVDGENLLTKLASVPVREWNYKAQDAAIRHLGPTAQDFRAAFGLGDFPLRINSIDASGVALAGVKALEARTRDTDRRLALEGGELDALRQEVAALRQELEVLRTAGRER